MCEVYKNYEELLEKNSTAVKELLDVKGNGRWQKEEIYFHSSVESFAEYELTEGWYIDLNLDRDFNGAPNPLFFINLEELGEALANAWDDTCNYLTKNGEVLSTSYGW